ncbi:hypothetical protein TSTA_061940 [Talaromyces stipitatus ATCC 10500]|uniref:Ankyrin 2,3/unc44 n=1 Tax=Talaromyces stipitatus (strain ATCC 10500 / CBS 375.48 / QM 6759 / NRRL 1006) TaxID=441959 RepID=B8LX56_TALSN|nr:uncharacterized protein TSTA_061940 [Talaromyces stipitatus ATCC 10500]EED22706.1 hypothetical protein TSTA_061940 [Talaromyces stipitatus ATCC 10500]
MATSGRKLYACEVAAYSDMELDRFLEEIRDSGAICVDIEDPENLPQLFYQRLRDRWLRAPDAVKAESRPLNLDQVTARLLEKQDNKLSPRSSTSSTEAGDEENEYNEDLKHEKESYHILVNDGCRPWYSIDHFDDVTKNPEEHRDKLWLWRSYDDQWRVFGSQLGRWQVFRKYQRYAREQKVENERTLCIAAQNYTTWEEFTERCPAFYLNDPERERFGFPEYIKALEDRLIRHGFTRKFQLDDDPHRQDRLTTWIEYLGYEYGEYDRCVNLMKRLQRQYDESWKMLIDSEILRPEETEEHINDITSAFQRQHEESQTEESVESALSAIMSAQQAITNSRQSLAAAQSKLATAIQNRSFIKKRNDLISRFKRNTENYRIAKHEAGRYDTLLQWMLQQVPLIELEISQSKAIEKIPDCRGQKKSLKRGPDEVSEHPKRQKCDNDLRSWVPTTTSSASQERGRERGGERSKRTHLHHTFIDESSSTLTSEPCGSTTARGERGERLRRSARIHQQTRLDSGKKPHIANGSNKLRQTRNKQQYYSDRQIAAHQGSRSRRRCQFKKLPVSQRHSRDGNPNEAGILLPKRRYGNQSQLVNPLRRSERLRNRADRCCEG